MGSQQTKALAKLLDSLEAEYGVMQATEDPVEAGFLAILAEQAPDYSSETVRDRLRMSFVNWNEMRVAEPWDVVMAMGASGKAPARKFAKVAGKYLRSMHSVLNRCSFDTPALAGEVEPATLVAKMRGVPATSKVVMLATLSGGNAPTQDISKLLQKMKIIPKTTSLAKAAKSLEAVCPASDLMRVHYLLGRYVSRSKDAVDPLVPGSRKKATPKKAAKKPAAQPTPAEAPASEKTPEPKKAVAKKATAKKATAKKPAAKKPAVKKAVKKTTK